MSRDISGNYTLPGAVNPVVAGTNITVTWANSTLNDIAAALTDSLSRSGSGSMSAALKLVSGTVAAPGVSFASETSSGWYLAGAGDVRFSLGGTQLARFNAGNLTLTNPLPVASGGTSNTTAAGARVSLGVNVVNATSKSTDYTLVAEDFYIYHPSTDANNRTFTIDGSIGYAIGTVLTFSNMTANALSIAIATDIMYLAGSGLTGTRSLAQYGVASAVKVEAGVWIISGAGLS